MATTKFIRLKKPNEIDFNKFSGQYHFQYDNLKNKIGTRKKFTIYQEYNFYGSHKIHIKDLKGNIVKSCGQVESLCASMFKTVTPQP